MDHSMVMHIAKAQHDARKNKTGLPQWSESLEDFKTEEAYKALWEGIKLREVEGEKVIALKMGLTSKAKREQMNLDSPLYGVLTDSMQIQNGGTFPISKCIHPKVEPEIAFKIAKDIDSPLNESNVYEYIEAVAPALEILDSRYEQFKYFSLQDVVADNSSSSHYIIGDFKKDFKNLDLKSLKLEMNIENGPSEKGTLDAINGDPVISLIQLSELLEEKSYTIPKGFVVLAGAATAAIALEPGMKVSLEMQHMNSTSFSVES